MEDKVTKSNVRIRKIDGGNGEYVSSNTINKKPKKKYNNRHKINIDYDFLQYIRIIFRWAMDNSGLTRRYIETLLYFYPIGVFSKAEYSKFHKIIGMYYQKSFDELLKGGWIVVWRPKKGYQSQLYTLSRTAKTLCTKMHKYSTGDLPIPESYRNKTSKRKDTTSRFYMDIIKKINKSNK